MAGLQSGEGCMTIDSVVWAQYINVTHTHSHVVTAIATLTHCVRAAITNTNPNHNTNEWLGDELTAILSTSTSAFCPWSMMIR